MKDSGDQERLPFALNEAIAETLFGRLSAPEASRRQTLYSGPGDGDDVASGIFCRVATQDLAHVWDFSKAKRLRLVPEPIL
jgi:hypothetical protein